MSKKIFFHIGPGKTGTSAIQAWLLENRKLLSENGVLYPSHEQSENKISSGNFRSILKLQNGIWSVDKERLKKLVTDFENSDYKCLLLSSEHFFVLVKELLVIVPHAIFIMYLRNPIELLESNYNQGVKRHGFVNKFDVSLKRRKINIPRFTNILNLLPNNQVIVRSYDLALELKGGIIEDFTSILGVKTSIRNKTINTSYSLEALEVKRVFNLFEIGDLSSQLDYVLQGFGKGTKYYSLIPPDIFESYKTDSIHMISELIEKYALTSLMPVIELISDYKQRPYFSQTVSNEQIIEVIEYIKVENLTLFNKLSECIAAQSSYELDYMVLYKALEIDSTKLDLSSMLNSEVVSALDSLTIAEKNKPKVVFQLAHLFESLGYKELSENFVAYCCHNNSENKNYYNKLVKLHHNNQAVEVNESVFSKVLSFLKSKCNHLSKSNGKNG